MPNLNELTEVLNGVLAQCECALEKLGLGVTAEVPLEDMMLVFGKFSGNWRLIIRTVKDGEVFDVPLTNASRHVRVLAVSKLEDLRLALDKAYEANKIDVARAIETSMTFLTHF